MQGVLSSAYFSLTIDETTDVAVLNVMVIYARYIENGKVATNFLKICELFNGTADTTEPRWYRTQWSGSKTQMTPTNSHLYPLCVPLLSTEISRTKTEEANRYKVVVS